MRASGQIGWRTIALVALGNVELAVQFSLLFAPAAESVFTYTIDEICRRSLNVIKACIYNGR